MKRALCTLLASTLLCGEVSARPPTGEQLSALSKRQRCDAPAPRQVRFSGDSAKLADCLERLGQTEIAELRITSGGGDAWDTLEIAKKLRGHLDLVVVDGMCASSCANYLLPVAKRVRVEPHAYVLLHGSIEVGIFDRNAKNLIAGLEKQLEAQKPELSPESRKRLARQKFDEGRRDIARQRAVQREFAAAVLTCDDWLDPTAHLDGTPMPEGASWLLVTPQMAGRCFKGTQLDDYWPPESQLAFDPKLGFFRALK